MFDRKVKLNSGYEIPMLGLGTWMINDESKMEESIRNAIKNGYRNIDTALIYKNEKLIGNVIKKLIKEKVIKREDLFITSKLWNTYHEDPEKGLRTTLDNLQLDYLDLYLVHWPVKLKSDKDFNFVENENGQKIVEKYDGVALWKKMESLVDKGLTRSIGVANHGIENLQKILNVCRIKPALNQFEIHPYLSQNELVDYCFKNGITVMSYSSLGGPNPNNVSLKDDKDIKAIAEKYKKTVPQVILSWLIMRDILIIPKSVSEEHIKENAGIFELSNEDFQKISKLNRNYRFNQVSDLGPDRFK
ncbi:hypothetical protein NCER_101151 [Vairimorpha ceranae BRL01]|uniref:NADP-dependent oxidoreductase domain-containing protein n=2 Tax=Vairimorpha ceranae TaxID=40302 RepID=C4V9C1_VAIC1|nr:aldo-keto reductase [Vairimorpha ceranae]EEQ82186.1 hypothetical protein NCER_101151 [Vairimorpha ceranae BRL01]KAF5140081.1 hypothetical protein G9O61_00g018060 [Vairimorpha ceranae]KKO76148.1 aldo-keto reductase [Vairimorpha ceranae]